MNGRNNSGRAIGVRYRNSSYTKKRVKAIVIICAVVLSLIEITLLIVGNVLRARSEEKHEKPIVNENDAVVEAGSLVPSVNGYAMSLSNVNSGNATLSGYASQARSSGGTALCFAARDSLGKELYTSSLASSMGKQTSSGRVSLRDINNSAGSLRTSAGVNISAFSEKNAVYRSVLLAYDAGICAELYEGGVDDVFIRLTSSDVDSENIEALLNFAQSVKNINSSVVLGIALTSDFFYLTEADTLIDRLSEKYDFLLLDLTKGAPSGANAADYVKKSVDSAQLYVMMYEMRVLLPETDKETTDALITALRAKSIDNWQVYIP